MIRNTHIFYWNQLPLQYQRKYRINRLLNRKSIPYSEDYSSTNYSENYNLISSASKYRNGTRNILKRTKMLPEMENCDAEEEEKVGRSSTRSCPSSLSTSATRRSQFPRRSLKELRIDVGRNLEPLVHRVGFSGGMERICEDPPTPKQCGSSPVLSSSSDIPPRDDRRDSRSTVERLELALHTHYYTIAYTLVIISYLAGFIEYLYFRLVSFLIPERRMHHPTCEMKANRQVGKDGFHYGISLAAFVAIAFFQLICFFGLTISERWTVYPREYSSNDQNVRKRHDLAEHIRNVIVNTTYRIFMCYGICSFINCTIIFYMLALQDSLNETVSTIFLYLFDVVIILYFIAFPLTTVIYHPHVRCFKSLTGPPPPNLPPLQGGKSQSSTLESTVSMDVPQLEEYVQSPTRHIRTSTLV